MFVQKPLDDANKEKFYSELYAEIESLLDLAWFTNLSNASAALKFHLRDVNWAGFYLAQSSAGSTDQDQLLLGPFQGLPACLRIAYGRGVCGTAAQKRETVVVDDVDRFPGHIACDSASRSEIVIPLIQGHRLLGVLDIDSPILNRFDDTDRVGLEKIAKLLSERTQWPDHLA